MLKEIKKDKVFIVVPAYNEEKHIGKVIDELKSHGWENIIVIDDGSKDKTYEIAQEKGVIVLRHHINRGLGATLVTGFEAAKILGAEIVVTFDGDGQHHAEDIEKIIKPILKGKADFVVGTRYKRGAKHHNTPWWKHIGNFILNLMTFFLFYTWSTDTQSGLRAIRVSTLKKMKLVGQRMEISSELIIQAKRVGARIEEVPIKVTYHRKGQGFKDGIKLTYNLLVRRLI